MLSAYSAESVALTPSAVLLVSAHTGDHDALESIFRGSRWKLRGVCTASDGLKTIRRSPGEIPVVICQHSLPDGDWKFLLAGLNKAAGRPRLIVSSRLADDRLWAEVLNLGAFDLLLGAPFEPEEVLRVTGSAWSAWHSAARPSALPRICPESPRRDIAARG